jgi:hypothetical protein
MISDAQTAKLALDLMNKADSALMESLDLVRANCSDEEYKGYRGAMSHVLGRLFFLLMDPIYRQHPSLAPPDAPPEFVRAWKNQGQ